MKRKLLNKKIIRNLWLGMMILISLFSVVGCGKDNNTASNSKVVKEKSLKLSNEDNGQREDFEEIPILSEELQEAEWVQAYQDFLSCKENFLPLIKDEYGSGCEKSIGGYVAGFALLDINQDSIPELLLNKRENFLVYVYSYLEGKVQYIGRDEYNIYEEYITRLNWGFDKKFGKVYLYAENNWDGKFHISLRQISYSQVTGDSYEYIVWGGSMERDDDSKLMEDMDYYWKNREEIWTGCQMDFANDMLQDDMQAIMNDFVPLIWHPIQSDEIQEYVNMEYQKSNLLAEQNSRKYFFVEHKRDYVDVLTNVDYNKLILYHPISDCEECGDYEEIWIDSEHLCGFSEKHWFGSIESQYIIVEAPDGYVNFRTGPGKDYDIITSIDNGEQLEMYTMESSDRWGCVRYNDQYGWVAISQVSTMKQHEEKELKCAKEIVITQEDIERMKASLGVPETFSVTIEKGEPFYWDVGLCALTRINLYHNGEWVAGANFDNNLEPATSVAGYNSEW